MPYPQNHPLREVLAEYRNTITNILFEDEMTGDIELDPAEAFAILLKSTYFYAFAIEDLMDQADFDPAKVVPRTVDEI
ncbi:MULTISPECIES: hypothetical protein [unclassified Nocardioides]|uniref:hypothetical protein n=1 Tax=unclassified Nocardioides TaxID=2615069 RepID=UPI0000571BE6|nr:MULTISPECIES: hypothetical protein [unclassified Nocardioides]ABL80091.1 hypothetical protein Noca_0549 [Nocardioides sp. JS614]